MEHLDKMNFGSGSFINLNGILYNTNAIVSVQITANDNLKRLIHKKAMCTRESVMGMEMYVFTIPKITIDTELYAEFNIAGQRVDLKLPGYVLELDKEYKIGWHIYTTKIEAFHKEHDFIVEVLRKAKQKLITKVLSELQDELNKKPAR